MKFKKLSVALAAMLAVSISAGVAGCSKDNYDLVYASWNLSTAAVDNVERKMIRAFEEKFGVKVKIEEGISINAYDDSMDALATKNKLPDVYMLSRLDYGLNRGFVTDLTEYAEADADWDKIPKPIEEAVHFGKGIYAVPFAMHMMGYFANIDLLEDHDLYTQVADGEMTMAEFENIVGTMANYKTSRKEIGLSAENTILEWYPASVDPNLGWFTWDGEKYNLNSDAFKSGIEKTAQFHQNGWTYDSLTEDERELNFGGITSAVDLWNKGQLALRWGVTYETPDMHDNANFEIQFLGVPGGRTPIVGDYLAISSTCQNVDLAYKFAKWMSFDPDGIRKRIELDDGVTNTLPITTDATIVGEYFAHFDDIGGIEEKYETLDNGIVEGVKVIPGYTGSRWNYATGKEIKDPHSDGNITNAKIGDVIDACWYGTLVYAEYAKDIDAAANSWYQYTIRSYKDKY